MKIRIFEMAARDGLQSQKRIIPASDKIMLVDLLSQCGFSHVEVTAFVSPKWVPQLADAPQIMAGITRKPGVRYTALVPNLEGYRAAKAAGAHEVAVFASASEGFSRANINCTIDESLERFAPVLAEAKADGTPVRGYVSCVTDCPFDGKVAPKAVAGIAGALAGMGCYEISLGDTIGHATPKSVRAMLGAVLAKLPPQRLAGHFHDTKGMALANIEASLACGIATFDASVGGLGGCPYAPGAAGNVDTLAVARLMARLGHETGLDMKQLERAAAFARSLQEQSHAV